MSILNIGLQNCVIGRASCSDDTEKLLQPCKMMKHLREKVCKHPEIKKEWKKSISGVQDLLHGKI